MSSAIKKATGLTGLHVAKNPHHTLTALYNKILRAVAKMPQDAAYRRYTEQIVSERAKVVATTPSVREVEDKINCGQVEELILQAENELTLARKMLGWKPWEPLVKQAPATQWSWPPAKIHELKPKNLKCFTSLAKITGFDGIKVKDVNCNSGNENITFNTLMRLQRFIANRLLQMEYG